MYSMKDLSSIVGKSEQALYSLIKSNTDLSTLVKQKSSRTGRFVKYDQAVLDWLLDYYAPSEEPVSEPAPEQEESFTPSENPIPVPPEPPEAPQTAFLESRVEELTLELERLKSASEGLKIDLDRERSEKQEIIRQNGQLLLLLGQEKQEKHQLLLAQAEPERLTFRQRLSTLFKSKK